MSPADVRLRVIVDAFPIAAPAPSAPSRSTAMWCIMCAAAKPDLGNVFLMWIGALRRTSTNAPSGPMTNGTRRLLR